MGDERDSREHFREGKKHLERGTQKVLKQGSERLEYYRENRSELVENLSSKIGDPKKPATAGTIVLAPVFVTLLVVGWLFDKIAAIPGNQYFNIATGFGINNAAAAFYINQTFKLTIILLLAGIAVTGVGRLVNTRAGFRFEKALDTVFGAIPFLGTVYDITKVSTETVLGGSEDFSRPVKLEVNGLRLTGFKTGKKADDGRDIIFVPTAPNITSGFVVELEEEDYEDTGETAESALTRILSAGFGHSEGQRPVEEEE